VKKRRRRIRESRTFGGNFFSRGAWEKGWRTPFFCKGKVKKIRGPGTGGGGLRGLVSWGGLLGENIVRGAFEETNAEKC